MWALYVVRLALVLYVGENCMWALCGGRLACRLYVGETCMCGVCGGKHACGLYVGGDLHGLYEGGRLADSVNKIELCILPLKSKI
jgi:hypothetical protein